MHGEHPSRLLLLRPAIDGRERVDVLGAGWPAARELTAEIRSTI
jgi:hypothetical protein